MCFFNSEIVNKNNLAVVVTNVAPVQIGKCLMIPISLKSPLDRQGIPSKSRFSLNAELLVS